jgi:hypothetical protein
VVLETKRQHLPPYAKPQDPGHFLIGSVGERGEVNVLGPVGCHDVGRGCLGVAAGMSYGNEREIC